MRLQHKHFAPLHAASNDETRENICALHIDKTGAIVGTDGHMMAVIHPPKGEPNATNLGPENSITIRGCDASRIGKTVKSPKGNDYSAEAQGVGELNGSLEFALFDGETRIGTTTATRTDSPFPDWRMVIPKAEDKRQSVGIDVRLLERLCATVRQFTGTSKGKKAIVELRFGDELDIIEARTTGDDKGLSVLVMPCRLN